MAIAEYTSVYKAECDGCGHVITEALQWKYCNELAKEKGAKWLLQHPKWLSKLYCKICWQKRKQRKVIER